MKVGVIGGGFKPPHKGHFAFAKKAIEKVPDLDKLIIYVGAAPSGTKDRPGFPMTQKQSVDIWKLYAKHLPGTVEIVPARKPPIGEIYSYATKNPDTEVQWFLGVRNEDDMKDVADRQSHLKKNPEKYSNLNVVVIDDTGSDVSGTALRKALDNKDKELAFTMIPDEVDREAVYNIFMDSPENRMAEVIDGLFEGMTNIAEGSGGVPIDAIGAVPSKDKANMDHRFKYFMNLTPPDMTISRRGMEIIITMDKYAEGPQPEAEDLTPTQNPLPEAVEDSKFNFTPYIASILEYCMDRELKVTPLPEITVKYDPDNAENLFGKTGYYDPSNSTIVIFASGRHPKDVLRSFCHELIHHMQNLEGKDLMFTTSNVHADDRLKEIEEEAHSKGSLLFREWENSNKEQQPVDEKKSLTEKRGRLNPISNRISSIVFNILKQTHAKGKTLDHTLMVGPYEDADITEGDLEFDLRIILRKGDYNYTGGANSGQDIGDGEEDPYIEVVITLPEDFNDWEELSLHLKDLLRHEIEHLKQGGINVRPGGEMEDDSLIRSLINIGNIPEKEYYKLEKEVDAMLQGLWMQAKKSRRPLIDVVREYLESQGVSLKDQEEILSLWSKRLPALGVPEDQQF